MRIEIIDRAGLVGEDEREVIERRMLFALSRYAPLILRLELTIVDVNGPRGGEDVQCRFRVIPKRGDPLIVVQQDADLLTCAGNVTKRMGRAVSRFVDRSKNPPSGSGRIGSLPAQ